MNSASGQRPWYEIAEVACLPSPCLLVYRQRVVENVKRMLTTAGGPQNLRPHIKTHKMRELVELQRGLGVAKFKCATIAEAEMAAEAGATDLLLAYQPVGPAAQRVAQLLLRFPHAQFSVIADDSAALRALSRAIQDTSTGAVRPGPQTTLGVFVDLDVGQHRTGLAPGAEVVELYRLIASLPRLTPVGLHAYDGHVSEADPARRAAACDQAFAPVTALRARLQEAGFALPRVVAGGTPTFPFHAKRSDVECSPGTCVFWDAGYATKLRDLEFVPAALVLTRVVSKPGPRRLCLDLGHKAIASEMPHPRVRFLNLEEATAALHSEEHLVVETDRSPEFNVGDCLYGVPWHICPTVALHSEAIVIENGNISGAWAVAARDRRLTL